MGLIEAAPVEFLVLAKPLNQLGEYFIVDQEYLRGWEFLELLPVTRDVNPPEMLLDERHFWLLS